MSKLSECCDAPPVHEESAICSRCKDNSGYYDPTKIKRVDLISREESLDGGWFEWRCEVEYEDGRTEMGYVQADYSGEGEPEISTLELDKDN